MSGYYLFSVAGDVVYQYYAPFTFTRNADNTDLDLTSTDQNDVVALVYEQTAGSITVPIETDFCGPQLLNRLQVWWQLVVQVCTYPINSVICFFQTLDSVVTLYNLGTPVAGTFMKVGYGTDSNQMLCLTSKCLGSPFPFSITGVNDAPECQP